MKGKCLMKNRFGTLLMILGSALLLAALTLFLWNRREDRQAGTAADEILPKMAEVMETAAVESYSAEMTEVEIDGHYYIGYISIPSLGLELPVMSRWDDSQLKIAPCRYAGSTKTGDLVIAAHNYASHFGNIKNLSVGDKVYFTDMNREVNVYEVAEMELLASAAVAEMTEGDYALTLFTCDYSGRNRVTVRCGKAEK